MKTKFAFKLNQSTPEGVKYTMDILNPLDKFINESGLIFMYNDSDNLSSYTKNDLIGTISSYSISYDYIILNFDIINTRFESLKNLDTFPLSIPLIEGEIIDGEVKVKEIKAVVIVM